MFPLQGGRFCAIRDYFPSLSCDLNHLPPFIYPNHLFPFIL